MYQKINTLENVLNQINLDIKITLNDYQLPLFQMRTKYPK